MQLTTVALFAFCGVTLALVAQYQVNQAIYDWLIATVIAQAVGLLMLQISLWIIADLQLKFQEQYSYETETRLTSPTLSANSALNRESMSGYADGILDDVLAGSRNSVLLPAHVSNEDLDILRTLYL